jgi:hypothetical protein
MKNILINKTNHVIFDEFNAKYSEIIVSKIPLLSQFPIYAINIEQSEHLNEMVLDSICDAFACFISHEPESTFAEIVINETVCSKLQLSNEEKCAAISHEIGHILQFFNKGQQIEKAQEEINCDILACCIMGESSAMLSLLSKLEVSGMYSTQQNLLMIARQTAIQNQE